MSASLAKISGLSRSIVLAAVTVVLLGMSEVGASAEQPAAEPATTAAPGVKSRHFTAFKPRTSLQLLSAPDRYLSLWRTPLMLSTGAVGYLVFLLGRVRLTNLFIVCR
jgi:hypothetical protein